MPKEALPDPNMKYDRLPIAGNNHPISQFSLARKGAFLLGGLSDISTDGTATFKNNLQDNIRFSQAGYDFLVGVIEDWISKHSDANKFPPAMPEPEWEPYPPLLDNPVPTTLNLRENHINTVLWATGWKADLSWLHIDSVRQELGPHGRPEACDTPVPGFFLVGLSLVAFSQLW